MAPFIDLLLDMTEICNAHQLEKRKHIISKNFTTPMISCEFSI